jgi:hypothetical protein
MSMLPADPAAGTAGIVGVSVFLQGQFNENAVAQNIFVKSANVE